MARVSVRGAAPWIIAGYLAALIAWKLHKSHFDWTGLASWLKAVNLPVLVVALVVIQVNYVLRAMRWAVFLRPSFRASELKPVAWWGLVGSQFVGFTGLAVFGRIGELIRPLLVARRTGLSFSSQVAVVAVERVFDLGAFGLLFSLNLAFAPGLQSLPHHELFRRVGFAIAGLTLMIAVFVLAVRLSADFVAGIARRVAGLVSRNFGDVAAEKLLLFRDGLNVIDSVSDFLLAALLSLGIWLSIALTYVLVVRAFPSPVHELNVADAILLLGFSVVGSIVQLPGVGGGAQALMIGALTQLFSIPGELAVSAGLMIWLVGTMSVIPIGVVYARVEGISIRQMARNSEAAEEQLEGS